MSLLLHCPCGHTINFEKSDVFCTKTYGRPNLKNSLFLVHTGHPPLIAKVLYGKPLRERSNVI